LRSDTTGCGSKNDSNDSQNSDTTAPCGRKLCYLQFSVQAAILETFVFTVAFVYFFTLIVSESNTKATAD